MAIDEAILEAHLNLLVPPTLRFYEFSPPAVSFGYAQAVSIEQERKIRQAGFDVVRRPSGGRAVLHLADLTYSFVCSSKNSPVAEYKLVSESIIAAYREICQALLLFLTSLGVEAKLGTASSPYQNKQDCFASATGGDILYKESKLVGSAQLRRKHGVLQHGSIMLDQPQTLMNKLLSNTIFAEDTHHANLYEVLKCKLPVADLEQKLLQSFQQTFHCWFFPKEITPYELKLARKIREKTSLLQDF